MKTPQTPRIQQIKISDIHLGTRMRAISEAGVESLKASILELGVMKDPVQVRRKGRGDSAVMVLMAGGHRLEAAKQLGWPTVPAMVWSDVTDDWAALMEIDDNLSGADLSTMELAVFLAKRKVVYERMHPEAKQGGDRGNQHTGGRQNDTMSFCQSVAEKRDISQRQVERLVKAGKRLSDRDVRELSQAPEQLTLKDLFELGNMENGPKRDKVIERLKQGKSKSVREAAQSVDPQVPLPLDPTDQAFQRLLEMWGRANMAARRRFLDDRHDEIYPLMVSVMEGKS